MMFRQTPDTTFSINLFFRLFLLFLLPLGVYVGHKIKDIRVIKIASITMLMIQIMLFYWYTQGSIFLAEGLPIYLCRIMMFLIGWNVLINKIESEYNFVFSLMGITGAILSFFVPEMSHFNFPHITNFSFVLGHFLLLVISVYLLKVNSENSIKEQKKQWFVISWMILLLQVLSSFVVKKQTGVISNYGFVYDLPLLKTTNPILNTLLIFIFLTLSGIIIEKVLFTYKKASENQ